MVDSATQARRARFGSFGFDPESGELRRDGEKIHLQEQPARILGILLQRAGHIVTREELREALWPADTFVDFDHGLNTAIRKLRAALGDSSEAPRCIETVARRGYRFLGTVEWQDAAAAAPHRRRVAPRAVLISIAAAVALAAIAASLAYLRRPAVTTSSRIDSIAVLPFAVSDPAIEYLGDGLAETLIDELSTSPGLRVAPRSSTFRYMDKVPEPREIGKQLGIGAVVTGALRATESDGYELQVEIIDAADGSLSWSKRYRVRAADLPVLRRQLAFDISYRLGVSRADDALRRADSSPAWDLYLRGRYLWNRRGRDDVLQAAKFFEQAVQLDPDFALGHAGLAVAYGALYGNNHLPGSGIAMAEKSKAAVDRALQLDDTLAEAYASRGAGYSSYFWDFEAAERDLRRAIELRPGYAPAHTWYAFHLQRMGRLHEARREIELAYALEPFSRPTNSMMCWLLLWERRHEDAIAFCRRTATVDVTLVNFGCLFENQAIAGRYEDAIATIRTAPRELNPSDADAIEVAYREGGPAAFWAKRAEQVGEADPYTAAECYSMAGDREMAFAKLDIAYRLHTPQLTGLLYDPMFDNLLEDPRLTELARRIGLPQVKTQPLAQER